MPRSYARFLTVVLLTLAWALTTASSCQHTQRGGGGEVPTGEQGVDKAPEIEDPALKKDLKMLADALNRQDFSAARPLLRKITREEGEAWSMGRLYRGIAAWKKGDSTLAAQELKALLASEDNRALRNTASLYQALVLAHQGELPAAYNLLHSDFEGARPPSSLLEADATAAMVLLGEARADQDEPEEALRAFGWAYELAASPDGRNFVFQRALSTLRSSPNAPKSSAGDDFLCGLAGALEVFKATDSPNASADSLEALSDHFQTSSPCLVRLQQSEIVEEMALRLAHLSGPGAVRIGVLLPLTGKARRVGGRALAGALLAQKSFRSSANPRSTVLFWDTRSDPEHTRKGVEALAAQGVSMIVGPLGDEEARSASEVAEDEGVPLIAMSLDPRVADRGSHTFHMFWDHREEIRALFARAQSMGVQRVAILRPDLPVPSRIAEIAQEEAPSFGIEIPEPILYDPKAKDFSREARRLRKARAEAVFVPDLARRVSLMMSFMATEGVACAAPTWDGEGYVLKGGIVCLGNSMWDRPGLLRDGGSYLQGATVASSYSDLADNRENLRFVQAHKGILGTDPDLFAAFSYDALRLARHLLLEKGLGSRDKVQEGLQKLSSFQSVMGPLREEGGRLRGEVQILEVKGSALQRAPSLEQDP